MAEDVKLQMLHQNSTIKNILVAQSIFIQKWNKSNIFAGGHVTYKKYIANTIKDEN